MSRILVVDDEPKNLYAMRQLLEDLGAELVMAQSGEEALRQVLKQPFAAILLDVRMPGIDGFETAAAIRTLERARRTPIIFVSAHADRRAGPRADFEEFLLKPVAPDVVRSRVLEHLQRYQQTGYHAL